MKLGWHKDNCNVNSFNGECSCGVEDFIRSHESRLAQEVLGVVNECISVADDEEKVGWTKHCTCLKAAQHDILAKFKELGITI